MTWTCKHCSYSQEIPTRIDFCPNCGKDVENASSADIHYGFSAPSSDLSMSTAISHVVCPICCCEVLSGDPYVICPDCKVAYHRECWEDNRGCAILGCRKYQPRQVSLEVRNDGTSPSFFPQSGIESGNAGIAPPQDKEIKQKGNVCPVCCTSIEANDEITVCPDCKMTYHKDCWIDNNGCATYGCRSAGYLNPPPLKVDVSTDSLSAPAAQGCSNTASEISCPQCHTQLVAGIKFCWACGSDLSSNVTSPLSEQKLKYNAWMLASSIVAAIISMVLCVKNDSPVISVIMVFCIMASIRYANRVVDAYRPPTPPEDSDKVRPTIARSGD